MTRRLLVLCLHFQRHLELYRERLSAHGIAVEAPPVEQQMREAELLEIISDFDAVIAGDDEITERVLRAGRRLRVIVKWGIGTDAIDLVAARRAGIEVVNTPGVFADEVADVVMGYLIVLARGLHIMDRAVRQGAWTKVQGISLSGRQLGVIGVGSIGRAVVLRARACGLNLAGHDPLPPPDSFVRSTQINMLPLPQLLASSDFIALTCPLNEETHHLLDERAFAQIKPGAYLVNVARGAVVDENALVDALRSGRLAGAALDVFEVEPLPRASPLREFQQCIFGAHNASNTLEAVLRTNEVALDKLLAGLGVSS